MAITARTRLVNPRLGTYFGIFAAAFAALVLMALMLEQLGVGDGLVRLMMFSGPLAFFTAIGVGSRAQEARDYFACGRRVPAFFNGLVLGVAALGGAGFLALTGCAVHHRLRCDLPRRRLVCRSRLHGRAVRALRA